MNKDLTPNEILDIVAKVRKGKNNPTTPDGFKLKSTVKYVAGLSDAIEQNQLLHPKNAEEIGITNIDKAKLSYPFIVTGITIKFDTATGAGVTELTAVFDDKAPNYWANGEIEISQDDVLFESPVSAIANLGSPTSVKDDVYTVIPFVLREEKPFKITPSLVGNAVVNQVYRLELHGIELVPDATIR
ncbi:hypothetical protein [Flavobacterium sp. J27]|uniref:hypothetical protein n=1 Tax=Flavobacterium sp. J27 TaxID=2060419 RepID=UPI0010307F72|nr:hypothetical protein [Flavobacterium sp. J27]